MPENRPIDNTFPSKLQFSRRCRNEPVHEGRSRARPKRTTARAMSHPSRFPSLGGAVVKLLFALKDKLTPEKSLKAYAWYHWY
ncbi:tryptorubin family RiPP precursor [Streptomyces sp. SCA2-4]|nr:tryptorubin family RiPP precursor [Streptomyces huiliensis]